MSTATEDPAGTVAGPKRRPVEGDLFHGRIPAGAVYVGRAAPGLRRSRWANPHPARACRVCGIEHDQADAVRAYAADLAARPDLAAAAVAEIGGRDLACWCRTGPCHADVLLAVANPDRDGDGPRVPRTDQDLAPSIGEDGRGRR